MDITITSCLNSSQKEAVQSLLADVKKQESLTVSFPMEDGELFLLGWIEKRLCTVLSFIREGELSYECSAFTHPSFRRQGLFSRLLEESLSLLPPEAELFFYTDGNSSDALYTLDSIGAIFCSKEHMMTLSPEKIWDFPVSGLTVSETEESGFPLLLFADTFGSVRIFVYPSHYYLYDFEIQDCFRNQGHGAALLRKVLSFLAAQKRMPFLLQVSGDNLPAIRLYEKAGFQISETLSCFLY
ncbi:N-acetyltransferase [Lachnospiraceae bacterium 45-P1]